MHYNLQVDFNKKIGLWSGFRVRNKIAEFDNFICLEKGPPICQRNHHRSETSNMSKTKYNMDQKLMVNWW